MRKAQWIPAVAALALVAGAATAADNDASPPPARGSDAPTLKIDPHGIPKPGTDAPGRDGTPSGEERAQPPGQDEEPGDADGLETPRREGPDKGDLLKPPAAPFVAPEPAVPGSPTDPANPVSKTSYRAI